MCALPEDARDAVNSGSDTNGIIREPDKDAALCAEDTLRTSDGESADIQTGNIQETDISSGKVAQTGTESAAADSKVISVSPARFGMKLWIAVCFFVIFADQITKLLARIYLKPVGDFPLIDGVLHLTYVENRGAAFGILSNHRWIFMLLSFVAVGAMISYVSVRRKTLSDMGGVSLALVIGGGIGNLIDRALIGYVTDFINLEFIHFAVFNAADSAVCIGAVLLIIYVIFFDGKDSSENAGIRNKA